MIETIAASAELTIRSSKKILYHPLEDHGYKKTSKMYQFVTTLNCRKTYPMDMIAKNVETSAFRPFCTTRHYENQKKTTLKLKTDLASGKTIHPSESFVNLSLHKSFQKMLQFHPEGSNIHNK